jgi:hypothetical protein
VEVGGDDFGAFDNHSAVGVVVEGFAILPSVYGFAFLDEHFEGLKVIDFCLVDFGLALVTELAEINDGEGWGHAHLHGGVDESPLLVFVGEQRLFEGSLNSDVVDSREDLRELLAHIVAVAEHGLLGHHA